MSKAIPIIKSYFKTGEEHPEGGEKFEESFEKQVKEIKERSELEKKQSSLLYRGNMFWAGIETQEQFDQKQFEAIEDYKSGNFFLERIGRFREVDAPLTMVLMYQRNQWIEEYEIKTIPELILLDMALVSYFHFLRLNEAVNNIMSSIEWDFFALEAPKFKEKYGWERVGGKTNKALAEELAYRLKEVLQPVLDQYDRSFIRNLKALRDLRRGNILLNIGNVGQMNIGDKQINVDRNS